MIANVACLTVLVVASATAQSPSPVAQAVGPDPAVAKVTHDIRVVRDTVTESTRSKVPQGMVAVSAGEVVLGTPAGNVESLGQGDKTNMTLIAAEVPRHAVSVDEFFIDVTEVTNLQWKVYLDATRRQPSSVLVDYGWPGGKIPEGQEHYPVTNVNIPEIRDYLAWSGKRLPTEAEWVRAARGGEAQSYPWGDRWNAKACQSGMSVPQVPVAVGTYDDGKSPFGALDLAGNVFEWVDSPFVQYPGFEPLDWKRGREKVKIAPEFNSTQKVIKGGAFNSTRELCRIDFRTGYNPSDSDAALGFRAARSAEPALDTVRHAYEKLAPPSLLVDGIDTGDIFGIEVTDYDNERRVIENYRYLAFAHRGFGLNPGYSKLKRSSVDEPFVVGILTTSEELSQPKLPAGSYTVAFKGKGESRKFKEWEKEQRRNGGRDENLPERAGDVMVPWPGIPVQDVVEDIYFDQEVEALLFLNANNAVVGMVPALEAKDTDTNALEAERLDDGRKWRLGFSVPSKGRRSPYFQFELELAGEPLNP